MAAHHDASDSATAANLSTFGLCADTVVLAARRNSAELSVGEQAAFGYARRLLRQMRSSCGPTVSDWAALRRGPPVEILDAAFDVAGRRCCSANVGTYIETLAESLEAFSAASATAEQRDIVVVFFDDVSLTTLRRAADMRWRRHRQFPHSRRRGRLSSASAA